MLPFDECAGTEDQRAATSLLTHPVDGSSRNCLAQAIRWARIGRDDIVFLSGPRSAPSVGHVVLRDTAAGRVREPSLSPDTPTCASLARYLALSERQVLATISASLLRRVLALDLLQRAQAIADIGAPLHGIERLAFGTAGSIPLTSPNSHASHPPSVPNAKDQAVQDWLDALGSAVSDDTKQSLASTADDATTLLNWFDAHTRGDPAIDKDMPQNVKDAESRLLQDKSVEARLVDPHDPTTITRDAIGNFVSDLDAAANSATKSWASFKATGASTDPITMQTAVDASILQANLPIYDAAGSSQAQVDGRVDVDDLKAIASSSIQITNYIQGEPHTNDLGGVQSGPNSHLPPALANAAAFYLNGGEFKSLDVAGGLPDTECDGLIDNNNFNDFLSYGFGSQSDTIGSLKQAALQLAVQNVHGDASKINPSYFQNPSKSTASAADKIAAYYQLEQTLARYDAGAQVYPNSDDINPGNYYWSSPPTTFAKPPSQRRAAFREQIVDKINQLGQDSDVINFINNQIPSALRTIVASDPALQSAVQSQYTASTTTKALQEAVNAKDSSGKPVSITDALAAFETNPLFYSQALGIAPDTAKAKLQQALTQAPSDLRDKVKQGYADLTRGKEIDDLVASGTPEDEAIVQATSDKTAYDMVLDAKTVASGTDTFNEVVSKLARDDLTKGLSVDDMLKALGVNGVDDTSGLTKLIDDNMGTLNPPGATPPSSTLVTQLIRSVNDLMRGGAKLDDALGKVIDNWEKKAPELSPTYKQGVFHVVSALLLGGALAIRFGSGSNSTPLEKLQNAQQFLQTGGLLAEGSAKYISGLLDNLKTSLTADKQALQEAQTSGDATAISAAQKKLNDDESKLSKLQGLSKDTLSNVENVAKGIGGVIGNVLGVIFGSISAALSAKSGDLEDTVVQSVFAGVNGIAALTSTGEIIGYVAKRLGTSVLGFTGDAIGGFFGAAGGALGAIGSVLALSGFVGESIYELVKAVASAEQVFSSEDSWYREVAQGFSITGITLPSELVMVDPDSIPGADGGAAAY